MWNLSVGLRIYTDSFKKNQGRIYWISPFLGYFEDMKSESQVFKNLILQKKGKKYSFLKHLKN